MYTFFILCVGKRVDWEHWKKLYVTGDDSVTFLSLSKMEGAPAFSTINNKACPPKKSGEPSWAELRKRYRQQQLQEGVGKEGVRVGVAEAIQKAEQIIDRAEMLAQHNILARKMLSIAGQAMKAMDPASLKPSDVEKFLKLGIDVQRTTEGMATSKTEVDFKGMSDAELDAIIDGNT